MSENRFVDYKGFQTIAKNVNARLKTVNELPVSPRDGFACLYLGESANGYVKGHIYQAKITDGAVSWSDLSSKSAVGIVAKGTIAFDDLPSLETVEAGWMYNINNDFTTDENFVYDNIKEKKGSNVYCIETDDGEGNIVKKWDVFAATEPVVVEEHYDEESTNAQSGVAVAEAVAGKMDKASTMPEATANSIIAYTGRTTNKYTNGHIYNAKTNVTYGDTWETKTWSGINAIRGEYVWIDGDNIYYSYNSSQYILDKATSTWSKKTWTGLNSFQGVSIWTDGDNIYYSSGSNQYILDKATSTWSKKTWTGLTDLYGERIWTDGDNIYYSNGSGGYQYVLDKSISTWSIKTWNGLTSFTGDQIWTDGNNIYHSNGSKHYILDKKTSTWNEKVWNGLTNFYGRSVWTDGDNIYLSSNSDQYVLDKETSTWNEKVWKSKPAYFFGQYIWSDGNNIYCSSADGIVGYQNILPGTKTYSWEDTTATAIPIEEIEDAFE